MFSGSLPNSTCSSSKVRTLDVSHNLLTGKLPSCYSSKSFKNQTVLFSFNCLSLNGTPNAKYQRPLSFCQNQASKAVAVEPVPKVEEKDSARSKLGLVILVIIGVVILAAILVVSVLIILRRRRSESEEDTFEVNNNNNDRHASDKASVCSNTTTSTKSLPDSSKQSLLLLLYDSVFSLAEWLKEFYERRTCTADNEICSDWSATVLHVLLGGTGRSD